MYFLLPDIKCCFSQNFIDVCCNQVKLINNKIISVMKSNRGLAILPKSKQRMLITADISNVLQSLTGNNFWKNATNKIDISKNTKGPSTTINNKDNHMTEDQIDKLFQSKSKNKVRTDISKDECNFNKNRNYLNQIKFLKMADPYDRLLAGLQPKQLNIADPNIQQLSQRGKKQDLTQKFKQNFLVGKIIGQGAYASVRVAIYKTINKKVAIKVYQKDKIKEPQRKKSVRRQIRILQQLDHSNIVRIYDVVETNNHLNIVMEYLDGISLNSFLKNQTNHKISENKCKKIIKELSSALKHLHQMYIAHRDLKLENVILDDNLSPKLIDFGFSTSLGKDKKVKIFCGTPSYMAPQIVQKKQYIGQKADIWALGVLFYVCITGIFPFKGSTDQQLYSKINKADYAKLQLNFSKQITDLIGKMLKVNPDQRITAHQILNHPWIKSESTQLNTQTSQPKQRKGARKEQMSNEYKKRITTMSSHKSKESWANKQIMRLTQTYKQNLKLELRLAKQSPLVSCNNTCTNRKYQKQNGGKTFLKVLKTQKNNIKLDSTGIYSKGHKAKRDKKRNQAKILDLFRNDMKVREQKQKSKGKKRIS